MAQTHSLDTARASATRPQDGLAGCLLCGALNRRPSGPAGDDLRCWRCASPLPESGPASRDDARRRLDLVSALMVSAWVCLVAAHLSPMVALELQGRRSAVTLSGASLELWRQDHLALSAALFVTTVLAPLLEAGAMLAAMRGLAACVAGRVPATARWLSNAVHLWQTMKGWNMTEVLILGAAVALVKLGQLATLIIGPAFVALMVFMMLRLAAMRLLSPAQAWSLLDPGRR